MSMCHNFMKTLQLGAKKNPFIDQGGFTFGTDILQKKRMNRLSLLGELLKDKISH